MNEIERLNPGLVVRAGVRPPAVARRVVAITGKRKAVLAELGKRQRAGEIETAGQLQFITEGPLAGQFAVRVVLIPARPVARWPKMLIGVGVLLIGVAAVVGAFAWLILSMTGAALSGLCLILLASLAGLVAAGRQRKGGNVTVISNINVSR
jgi:hypothetical protein